MTNEAMASINWEEPSDERRLLGHVTIEELLRVNQGRGKRIARGMLGSSAVDVVVHEHRSTATVRGRCRGKLVYVSSTERVHQAKEEIKVACAECRRFAAWYAETRQRYQTGVHMSIDGIKERIDALRQLRGCGTPYDVAKNAAERSMLTKLHERAEALARSTRQNYSL